MTGNLETNYDTGGRSGALWRLLPLAVFAIVALFFGYALMHGDPSKLPSTFIGRPAPTMKAVPASSSTNTRVFGGTARRSPAMRSGMLYGRCRSIAAELGFRRLLRTT